MRRLIWRGVGRNLGEFLEGRDSNAGAGVQELSAAIQWAIPPRSVLQAPSPGVRDWIEQGDETSRALLSDLAQFDDGFLADTESAPEAARRVAEVLGREVADIEIQEEPIEALGPCESLGAPSDLPTGTPPPSLLAFQRYLFPAPDGVDAAFAHLQPGGTGEGVSVIDFEQGWLRSHLDLHGRLFGHLWGFQGVKDHGTAALSVAGAADMGMGVVGVAKGCQLFTASIWEAEGGPWNPERALIEASAQAKAGDVLLVELQFPDGRPLEASPSFQRAQDAITGSSSFRYIVAAAGNGSIDLDPLNLERDTNGAVLVGAGHSALHATPRARISTSNHGRRVDCQAWGECVVSAGGRSAANWCDLVSSGDPRFCYSRSFSGTSSASAIVAGTVASLVGVTKARARPLPTPRALRTLLRTHGTPQPGPQGASERIGPLPNLRALIGAIP